MGFYIDTHLPHGKASQLEILHDAIRCSFHDAAAAMHAKNLAVICVIENPFSFEAALYCFNTREFARASSPTDARAKTWLLMDRTLAESLTNYPSTDGHRPEDDEAHER